MKSAAEKKKLYFLAAIHMHAKGWIESDFVSIESPIKNFTLFKLKSFHLLAVKFGEFFFRLLTWTFVYNLLLPTAFPLKCWETGSQNNADAAIKVEIIFAQTYSFSFSVGTT